MIAGSSLGGEEPKCFLGEQVLTICDLFQEIVDGVLGTDAVADRAAWAVIGIVIDGAIVKGAHRDRGMDKFGFDLHGWFLSLIDQDLPDPRSL